MHLIHVRIFSILFVIATAGACSSTQSLKIDGDRDMRIDVLDAATLNSTGDSYNGRPVTVDYQKVKDKVLKLSAKGAAPQYWFFTELKGGETSIRSKFEPLEVPPSEKNKDAPAPPEAQKQNNEKGNMLKDNLSHRQLMRAYQALFLEDYDTAIEISKTLASQAPYLAAPKVIQGLSLYQQGNVSGARSALEAARALDPQDEYIKELLDEVR